MAVVSGGARSPHTLPRVARIPDPVDDVDWPDSLEPIATGGKEDCHTLQPAKNKEVDDVASQIPKGVRLSVDYVRVSENTYALRVRWSNPEGVSPKRPAIYYQWIHADVFKMITEDKEQYVNYKASIIAQFETS